MTPTQSSDHIRKLYESEIRKIHTTTDPKELAELARKHQSAVLNGRSIVPGDYTNSLKIARYAKDKLQELRSEAQQPEVWRDPEIITRVMNAASCSYDAAVSALKQHGKNPFTN